MSKVLQALRNIPVAINCYYGDPTIQWDDTMLKLRALAAAGHTGPVGLIIKGAITPERAKELAAVGLPGLVVMASISELPEGFEGIGHEHRYLTIGNCRATGVKCFAAVRPIIPPYNTKKEVLERIFSNLREAGCEVACVSGFRGDAALIDAVNPDNAVEWVLRVKQMTGFDDVMKIAADNGVRIFTRVSCAVSYLTGRQGTYNPYWGSPQLVRCEGIDCPNRKTCGPVKPDQELLDWLCGIGYDLEWQPAPQACCAFSSDTRLNCQSCCTSCFMQKQPRVLVRNAETLGDLSFIRFFLGGTLAVKPGMVDGGDKDVGQVKLLQRVMGRSTHCINTWWVWARQLEKCFDCRYCISSLYPNKGPVGYAPEELEKLTLKK